MTRRMPQQYSPTPGSLLAVDQRAFFSFFAVPETRELEMIGSVAVLDIRGPLTQHDDGWCDSYEAIAVRVQEACDSAATAIVLRIDSPGGDAGGCFDGARKMREACDAAGKPLIAYVDGKACSAAYCYACAASQVVLGDSGIVGSIGVVSTRSDYSAANAQRGVKVALIASGSRKGDGNPDLPITEAELKASQGVVDSMAAVFFEIVGEFRKADPKAIAALDAQVFHGQSAIDAGLADRVQQFDQVLADIASGKVTPMATSYEKGRAAFEEAAKGDDANAAAAKRALAALDEAPAKGDDDEKDKPDEKAADDSSDKDAADDSSDKDAVDDSSDKDAAADGTGTKASARDLALQALAEVHTLKAEGAKKEITAERAKLLASRPDFAPEMRSLLETSDIKTVRKFCKDLPKGPAPKLEAAAAAATAAGTRGAAQGGTDAIAAAASTNEAAARAHKMDIAMGLAEPTLGCRREGNSLVFGIQHVSAADAKASAGSAK